MALQQQRRSRSSPRSSTLRERKAHLWPKLPFDQPHLCDCNRGVHRKPYELRKLIGVLQKGTADLSHIWSAAEPDLDESGGGQNAGDRVEDHTADRERNVIGSRGPGHHLRFHVHDRGACSLMEACSLLDTSERRVDSGNHALHRVRQDAEQPVRPVGITPICLTVRQHAVADQAVTGTKLRAQAAADAETDDAAETSAKCLHCQRQTLLALVDHGGAAEDRGLERKPDYCKHRAGTQRFFVNDCETIELRHRPPPPRLELPSTNGLQDSVPTKARSRHSYAREQTRAARNLVPRHEQGRCLSRSQARDSGCSRFDSCIAYGAPE